LTDIVRNKPFLKCVIRVVAHFGAPCTDDAAISDKRGVFITNQSTWLDPACLRIFEANYATRSTTTSFCQPVLNIDRACD